MKLKKLSAVLTTLTLLCSCYVSSPAVAAEEDAASAAPDTGAAATGAASPDTAAAAPDTAAAAPAFSLRDTADEDGIITTDDGQKWYKVQELVPGQDYLIVIRKPDGSLGMLSAGDAYVWSHFSKLDAKTSAPYMGLSCGDYNLACRGNQLLTDDSAFPPGAKLWIHQGNLLVCAVNGNGTFLKYDESAGMPFGMTDNPREAANVQIYTNGDTRVPCITAQPHADSYVLENSGYDAPTFTVETSDITVDEIHWYTDGVEQPGSEKQFTAETLAGQPVGVHRVTCLIEGHDARGFHYREMSAPASFVIAKGVIPDSVLTFSDIHEQYFRLGDAIGRVLEQKDGYLPSLVVFNGDMDSAKEPDYDTTYTKNYQQMLAAAGGLDTVLVQGNHDDATAIAALCKEAGLGAAADLSPAGGVIFRSGSEGVQTNGTTSRSADGIVVYGLNYGKAIQHTEDGDQYSYASALADMEQFLQETAKDYKGELIVIAAHSGLHVLGQQPESLTPDGQPVTAWAGDNAYNLDQSYEMAQLINRYAETYNMDIVYLFGHNHSKMEAEMLLQKGDTLYSTKSFADKSIGETTLHFTYANAGYLSEKRGSTDGNFALITRDGGTYVYELIRTRDSRVQRSEIAPLYQQYYATPERFGEMAVIDYERKNGIAVYPETVVKDGTATVTLKDADGKVADIYTLDAKTGIGTNAKDEEVNLPQTGITSPGALAGVGVSMLATAAGAYLVLRSLRRKKDNV